MKQTIIVGVIFVSFTPKKNKRKCYNFLLFITKYILNTTICCIPRNSKKKNPVTSIRKTILHCSTIKGRDLFNSAAIPLKPHKVHKKTPF